jgi:hypothetical protein
MLAVPVLTALGQEIPAELDGYGPIPAETARRWCGNASSFMRLLTHPETGAVLSVGRDSYTVPASLRRHARVRDRTCRFPGCNRAVAWCELDHTRDWQFLGPTAHFNLHHLCKKHHRLKHRTKWKVRQYRPGILAWTSPAGQAYTTAAEGLDGLPGMELPDQYRPHPEPAGGDPPDAGPPGRTQPAEPPDNPADEARPEATPPPF